MDSTQSSGELKHLVDQALEDGKAFFYPEVTSTPPNLDSKYKAFAFENPAEMYAFFRPELTSGRRNFHKWQAEELLRLAGNFSQDNPYKFVLCACNGSGKDSFYISPAAVWLIACKIRHKVIITSSSYNQLAKQTEPYIKAFCESVNEKFQTKVFEIKQGHIHCVPTGSDIFLFVTDEAGKAEGFHPYDDYADAEMTIIINESKSIKLEIFQALSRCTGYTRWLEVSSPGKTQGHMYDAYNLSIPFPEAYVDGKWFSRKITYLDCPHISKNQIEDDKILCGGETSEFFRSKYLAEFTNIDERVVVTLEEIQKCLLSPPRHVLGEFAAGLDLSGGRDETSLASRNGNKLLKLSACRIKDAVMLVEYLERTLFPEHGISKLTPIYADAGGMGEPIVDMLKNKGWNVIPVLNQNKAAASKLYRNRGTENWFNVGNAIRFGEIDLTNVAGDKKFITQLSNRHYDLPDNDKIALLSKQEERSEGNESPDRADAVALAFCRFQIKTTTDRKSKLKSSGTSERLTQEQLVNKMQDDRFSGFNGINNTKGKPSTQDDQGFSQSKFIEGMVRNLNNNRKN